MNEPESSALAASGTFARAQAEQSDGQRTSLTRAQAKDAVKDVASVAVEAAVAAASVAAVASFAGHGAPSIAHQSTPKPESSKGFEDSSVVDEVVEEAPIHVRSGSYHTAISIQPRIHNGMTSENLRVNRDNDSSQGNDSDSEHHEIDGGTDHMQCFKCIHNDDRSRRDSSVTRSWRDLFEKDSKKQELHDWKTKLGCQSVGQILLLYFVPAFILITFIGALSDRTEKLDYELCTFNAVVSNASTTFVSTIIPQDGNTASTVCVTKENDGLGDYIQTSQGWKICLSLIPFLMVFQGVLSYGLSSRYVAPFTLLVTIVIGLWFFEGNGWYEDREIVSVAGIVTLTIFERIIWTFFDYAFNVFSAFFFLRILQLWGVVDRMRKEFEVFASTPYKKIILVAFCFAIMVAVVAPGGSNFLIAGAILVDMNIMNLEPGPEKDDYDKRIGAICLFGNSLTSAFNLLGVAVIALAEDVMPIAERLGQECAGDVECATREIGYHFSVMFFVFSVVSPFLMCYIFTREKGVINKFSRIWPELGLTLIVGLMYAIVQLVVAKFLGPELPCLLAAGASLIAYLIVHEYSESGIRFRRPKLSGRQYVLPFLLFIGLLLLIRLVPDLEYTLQGGSDESSQNVLYPYVLNINSNGLTFQRRFPWLSHSGMIVFVSGLVTPFIVPFHAVVNDETLIRIRGLKETVVHPYHQKSKRNFRSTARKAMMVIRASNYLKMSRMSRRLWGLHRAFVGSIKEASPVMLSIGAYASLAKVMAGFSMTQTLANAIVDLLRDVPGVFAAMVPVIGTLGSGLTGSTTTSNFLFGQLQVETCIDLNLITSTKNSVWEVAGAQMFGATGGEMISPMNAVFSTLLLGGRFPESELIKLCMPIFFVWMVFCMIWSVIFLVPEGGFD